MHLPDRKILVTGASGFLGRHVVAQLRAAGCERLVMPRSREVDLRDQASVRTLFDRERPQVVIHLAAVVGGIGANRARPGTLFHDNLLMGTHVVEASRRSGVETVDPLRKASAQFAARASASVGSSAAASSTSS